jgi:hypothetical protein
MIFGGVSRAEYEAVKARAEWTERMLRAAEENLAVQKIDAAAQLAKVEARLVEEQGERKLLLDRIVQLSGQPALFEKTGTREEAIGTSENTQPVPGVLTTFGDAKRWAEKQLKDGKTPPAAGTRVQ